MFSRMCSLSLVLAVLVLVLGITIECANARVTMPHSKGSRHSAPPLLSEENTEMTLKRVVFAHRHGARTPVINVNGSCDQLGCGTLTAEGQGMLESLGDFFLHRYDKTLLPRNPATGKAAFDLHRVKTISDDSPRVVQSAGAFWNGIFGSNVGNTTDGAAHVPVIMTGSGLVINPWTQPGPDMHFKPMVAEIALNLTARINEIVDVKAIIAVGEEMGLSAVECGLLPPACLAMEVDFLQSVKAMGHLSRYPQGAKYLAQFTQVEQLVMRYSNGVWDETIKHTSYFRLAGWPGSVLAEAMTKDAGDGSLILSEFSGHDTSLMPLYAALGNLTFTYPLFGTALVWEVFEQSTTRGRAEGGASGLFVRAMVGTPEQVPGTGWPYTFSPYALVCLNASTQVPYTTTGGCPLGDLKAFIATRKPPSADGFCYGWPDDLKLLLCQPTENSEISISPKLPCGKFRAACPLQACGSAHHMVANLSCVPN